MAHTHLAPHRRERAAPSAEGVALRACCQLARYDIREFRWIPSRPISCRSPTACVTDALRRRSTSAVRRRYSSSVRCCRKNIRRSRSEIVSCFARVRAPSARVARIAGERRRRKLGSAVTCVTRRGPSAPPAVVGGPLFFFELANKLRTHLVPRTPRTHDHDTTPHFFSDCNRRYYDAPQFPRTGRRVRRCAGCSVEGLRVR